MIKPAAKGGNVVVWPIKIYEREALRQLKDPVCYKWLTFNPMMKFRMELKNILVKGAEKGIIIERHIKYLLLYVPMTPTFYMLPKVHSNAKNMPGHLIIWASQDCVT